VDSTKAGVAVGTLDYMSPEQALGDAVDARSDVFALGVVLYQMLTGARPFRGSSRSDLLRQIHFTTPASIATLRRGVPEELVAIVGKALQKRPHDRYASMREMGDALARLDSTRLVAPGAQLRTSITGGRAAAIAGMLVSGLALAGWLLYRNPHAPIAAINVDAAVSPLAGNRERARHWLTEAVKTGYPAKEISNDPELTALRADRRYHSLVASQAR
jgi:serine/threonine protein kinase